MVCEFFFQPCRYDGTRIPGKNPFTGKPAMVPRNAPLKTTELDAVQTVLDKAACRYW